MKRSRAPVCQDASNARKQFKHGNYNRYYGYRNENAESDARIPLLNRSWFEGKSCLDIGCNVGHLTLWISKHFRVKSMKGVDIDMSLIRAARSNVQHYIDDEIDTECIKRNKESENMKKSNSNEHEKSQTDCEKELPNQTDSTSTTTNEKTIAENTTNNKNCESDENLADGKNKINNNNTHIQHLKHEKPFPYNVTFVTENFVPASESLLKYVKPQYDVIICLSVTKWMQLNSGDEALKWMFKKIFRSLNPGGKLILEPQPFSSYKRRKNLSGEIRRNYDAIKLRPEDYPQFLLSNEVGFESCMQLHTLNHEKQGFKRPVYLLKKKEELIIS